MASKPDRPKNPTMRLWRVLYEDGRSVHLMAEYRGMARHYAKSLVEGEYYLGSIENYKQIKSVRLVREQEEVA